MDPCSVGPVHIKITSKHCAGCVDSVEMLRLGSGQKHGIATALEALSGIVRGSGVSYHLAMAQAVLDALFQGRLELWQKRRKSSDVAYRKLAEHPKLPVSAATLNRAMRIYELWTSVPDDSPLKRLFPMHLAGVLGLSHEVQIELLTRAAHQGWSVGRLIEEARKHRVQVRAPGRPRVPRVIRTLRMLGRLPDDALSDTCAIDDLELAPARALLESVSHWLSTLSRVERLLERRLSNGSFALPRILLIDPDAERGRVIAASLEDEGFSVRVVRSGAEALTLRGLSFACAVLVSVPSEDSALVDELVSQGLAGTCVVSETDIDLPERIRRALARGSGGDSRSGPTLIAEAAE